jgi:alanine racemase
MKQCQHHSMISPMSWAEIDLTAIKKNLKSIKRFIGKEVGVLAVVKADAYGHGAVQVAQVLAQEEIVFFGISDINEGVMLRQHGIQKPIFLMENVLTTQAADLIRWDLTPMICSFDLANRLNQLAKKQGKIISIHVKVDTGMRRLGVPLCQAFGFMKKLSMLTNVKVVGLLTHFPLADTNKNFTIQQIKALRDMAHQFKLQKMTFDFIHAANSMGMAGYSSYGCNLVRLGLMLYGLYPKASIKKKIKLVPAMSVKSKVCFVKDIEPGQGISYGHKFVAPKKMTIAIVALGYSNGYFRCLSGKAYVLIGGSRCPIIGTVTMDQIMVDVTHLKKVSLGAEVCILGRQGKEEISADELAWLAGTISYEMICSLGSRNQRMYAPPQKSMGLSVDKGGKC